MNVRIHALGERIHNALVDYCRETGRFAVDLGGMCAVGSKLLVDEAKRKYNIDMDFMATAGHAWTEYRGHIYDITATQFGHMAKVFSAPKSSLIDLKKESFVTESLAHYYEKEKRLDPKYINKNWPTFQKPKNYSIKWLNGTKARIIYTD